MDRIPERPTRHWRATRASPPCSTRKDYGNNDGYEEGYNNDSDSGEGSVLPHVAALTGPWAVRAAILIQRRFRVYGPGLRHHVARPGTKLKPVALRSFILAGDYVYKWRTGHHCYARNITLLRGGRGGDVLYFFDSSFSDEFHEMWPEVYYCPEPTPWPGPRGRGRRRRNRKRKGRKGARAAGAVGGADRAADEAALTAVAAGRAAALDGVGDLERTAEDDGGGPWGARYQTGGGAMVWAMYAQIAARAGARVAWAPPSRRSRSSAERLRWSLATNDAAAPCASSSAFFAFCTRRIELDSSSWIEEEA
jgi:hypothetical protein